MKKIPSLVIILIILISIAIAFTLSSLLSISYQHLGLIGIFKNPNNYYFIIPIIGFGLISIYGIFAIFYKLNNYLIKYNANTLKEKVIFIFKNHKIISLIIGIILLQKLIIHIRDLI